MQRSTKNDEPKSVFTLRDFVAGACGGMAQIVVGQPLDLIKTHIQMSQTKVSLSRILSNLWNQYGLNIYGYYKGASTMFIGNGLTVGLEFGLNETFKHAFRKYVNKDGKELIPISQIAICGAAVGFISSLVYTPMQFCKIRMQIKTPEYAHYKGATDIFIKKISAGQISDVFRGGLICSLRETLGALAYFTVYENYIRSRLREGEVSHTQSSNLDIITAGSLAGICYWFMIYPLDSIKTQIQTGNCKTYGQAFTYLKSRGLLFRGCGIAVIRSMPVNSANFLAFQWVQKQFKKKGW